MIFHRHQSLNLTSKYDFPSFFSSKFDTKTWIWHENTQPGTPWPYHLMQKGQLRTYPTSSLEHFWWPDGDLPTPSWYHKDPLPHWPPYDPPLNSDRYRVLGTPPDLLLTWKKVSGDINVDRHWPIVRIMLINIDLGSGQVRSMFLNIILVEPSGHINVDQHWSGWDQCWGPLIYPDLNSDQCRGPLIYPDLNLDQCWWTLIWPDLNPE